MERLVRELEATELPQGYGCLQLTGKSKYCCLGIGCRLAGKYGVHLSLIDGRYLSGENLSDDQTDVYDFLGLTLDAESFLIRLNDDDHLTFYQIAQVIRNMPELFKWENKPAPIMAVDLPVQGEVCKIS